MREVVIVEYLRTAQTRSTLKNPDRDWFCNLRADDLLAKLMPAIVDRAGITAEEIDDFIVGSALGVNEQWTYGGRSPIFLANFPKSIPAKFVDQQCGSSMAGIHIGFMEIATGFADTVLVGGMEHMTRVPNGGSTVQKEYILPNDRLLREDRYRHWDMQTVMSMGLTAERLFKLAECDRSDLDKFGVRSHQLAVKAYERGFFEDEILSIEAEQADGSTKVVNMDQAVRKDTSYDKMSILNPVFKKDGVITAGNSSPMSSGAATMLLMSKEKAESIGIKHLASIRSIGFAGVDPSNMGVGPIPATRMALEKATLSTSDIDYWEINEAFCVVPIHCANILGVDLERVNVMGGGTAIGHPLGVSGIRIVGTLARILKVMNSRFGCATACCGGGQGVATIIESDEAK